MLPPRSRCRHLSLTIAQMLEGAYYQRHKSDPRADALLQLGRMRVQRGPHITGPVSIPLAPRSMESSLRLASYPRIGMCPCQWPPWVENLKKSAPLTFRSSTAAAAACRFRVGPGESRVPVILPLAVMQHWPAAWPSRSLKFAQAC